MKIYLVLFILLMSITQAVYAGGYNFNIKITDIHSLSDDKHLIYFQTLEKIGYDDYPYPLDDCQNIKIIIDYKYKESWVRRMEQFFYLLFKDTSKFDEGVNALKKTLNCSKNTNTKLLILMTLRHLITTPIIIVSYTPKPSTYQIQTSYKMRTYLHFALFYAVKILNHGRFVMLIKPLLFMLFLGISQTVYAGGMIFPIQITDITTTSKKTHQLKFKLLEKVGFDGHPYPLDKCDVVTLNIEFTEWELHHKIFLFFDGLFNPILNTKYLNQEVSKLKTHLNKPILMSDVEAFYDSPHDDCQLLSKTITLQYTTAQVNDKSYGVILQPIRHHSRLENKPKD